MQITPFTIYLINLCDSLGMFLAIIFWVTVAVGIVYFGCKYAVLKDAAREDMPDIQKTIEKRLKQFSIVLLSILVIAIPVPDKKTLYEMIIVPSVANSKLVQNIPDYITKYLDKLTKPN